MGTELQSLAEMHEKALGGRGGTLTTTTMTEVYGASRVAKAYRDLKKSAEAAMPALIELGMASDQRKRWSSRARPRAAFVGLLVVSCAGPAPPPSAVPPPDPRSPPPASPAPEPEPADACTGLVPRVNAASALYEGRGVPKDVPRAIAMLTSACNCGQLTGCFNLGRALYVQGGDDARALALFDRTCNGGDREGCGALGIMLYEGRGTKADYERARTLLESSCDGDDGIACNHLGRLYWNGLGVPVDRGHAMELYRRACRLGDADGCWNASHP